MGGKPSKGTPKDNRLASNKKGAKPPKKQAYYLRQCCALLYRRQSAQAAGCCVIGNVRGAAFMIAVVLTINYGCIVREGRLRRISGGVPLVFGWHIVLFIMWAWKHQHRRPGGAGRSKLTGYCRYMSNARRLSCRNFMQDIRGMVRTLPVHNSVISTMYRIMHNRETQRT